MSLLQPSSGSHEIVPDFMVAAFHVDRHDPADVLLSFQQAAQAAFINLQPVPPYLFASVFCDHTIILNGERRCCINVFAFDPCRERHGYWGGHQEVPLRGTLTGIVLAPRSGGFSASAPTSRAVHGMAPGLLRLIASSWKYINLHLRAAALPGHIGQTWLP